MYMGIDLGFGDVKAVIHDGSTVKFPTAVTYAQTGVGDLAEFLKEEDEYLFQGRKYFLGEKALFGAFPTRSIEFLKKYASLLAYKAMEDLNVSDQVTCVVAGLPLAYYTDANKKSFNKSLNKIEVNDKSNRPDVKLFPQGVGILFDYRFLDTGFERSGTCCCGLVVDIGFNTIDIVAFENGSAIRADSAMLERSGISKIAENLTQHIQNEHKINLAEQEAKDILLKKTFTVYGDRVDLSEVIRTLTEEYADALFQTLRSRWEARIQRADKLIIAGGGAYYLKDFIPSDFRSLVHIPDNPEFSNARGFLKAVKSEG